MKAGFCSICCQRHFLDAACDPTDKRYTANARSMAYAEVIGSPFLGPALPRRRTDDEDLDAAYRDEGYELTQGGWR